MAGSPPICGPQKRFSPLFFLSTAAQASFRTPRASVFSSAPFLPFTPYRVANRSDDGEKNSVYIVICGVNNGAGIGRILKVARLLGWR
jgi:hypothetical protein